jgi:acetolactate synthase-1/2/3 large subunit
MAEGNMNNAELIVDMLSRAGVKWVFGVPSGPVLPLIEALRENDKIEFVLTATETSAAFMAEAAGRLGDAPGACVSTLGPGATNLATGVGGAYLDRSPVIAITCNYHSSWLERRTQMLIDHLALFTPLTKATHRLQHDDVAEVLGKAINYAMEEPPGPVHLDLPEDVATSLAQNNNSPIKFESKQPPEVEGIGKHVFNALTKSKRPLIVTGLTFTRCSSPLRVLEFIESQSIPFVTTLHAKGFLPESHPNSLGVMGRARANDIQKMISQADLIIGIGFDPVEMNYEEWVSDTRLIHLSSERADVDASVNLEYEAAGNIDLMIKELNALPLVPNDWKPGEWEEHRSKLWGALRPESTNLTTHQILDVLKSKLPQDSILTYDIGAHTHQIATQWQTDLPHTCVSTNGWSSMGYGMPSAYAAKLVHPDRTVVGVIGDGCFQMTAGELATAQRLNLNVPIIVLNDGWLGLMKIKQTNRHYGDYGTFLGGQADSPAHYFGAPCWGVRDIETFGKALDWALAEGGPTVIEAFIDVDPYSYTVANK